MSRMAAENSRTIGLRQFTDAERLLIGVQDSLKVRHSQTRINRRVHPVMFTE
jgi:hypothetical protein